jgi:hypothetical protein
MSTHTRLRESGSRDESYAAIEHYNLAMRQFFESGECAAQVGYIDVYNMTASLVHQHYEDGNLLTYDGLHWGMTVNLIKAQILLNAILS